MPLSSPAPRRYAEQRTVTCRGFLRDDGLWDIEGLLRDTRAVDSGQNLDRPVPAGEPIHEMHVRLTVDVGLVIRAIEVAMDAHPYRICHDVQPNFQRLVGLSIGRGFAKRLFAAVGHAEGCTHVVSLIQSCATVAVRTVVAHTGWDAALADAKDPQARPSLLNTCHSFSQHSPLVQRDWPAFYIAPAPRPAESSSST